jgi:putative DNA primase/helicase
MAESIEQAQEDRESALPTSEEAGTSRRKRGSRLYLFVPFEERKEASEMGADFDREKHLWYVGRNVDLEKFRRWAEPPREMSERDIEDDLTRALEGMGLVPLEPVTIETMDGTWRSTRVSTSKSAKALKGGYKAQIGDGRVSGYIKNLDTGEDQVWRPEGVILSSLARERIRVGLEYNRNVSTLSFKGIGGPDAVQESEHDGLARPEREAARTARAQALADARGEQEVMQAAQYERVAAECASKWDKLPDAFTHKYLDRKGVEAFGLRLDGDKLVTPVRDVDGKIWSLQYIPEDGARKMFSKGGKKSGNFHVLGDINEGKTVLFAEGYATCSSLHMASRLPLVEVFDAGNISAVLRELAPRLQGKNLIICGDDDVVTHEKVVRTILGSSVSDYAKERLGEVSIAADEIVVDGVRRTLQNSPSCSIELRLEVGPEGVERVLGDIRNDETGKIVPVKIVNGGREKALSAVAEFAEYGVKVTFPVFQSLEDGPSDYNDLHEREGLAVVRRQVGLAMLGRAMGTPALVRSPEDVARAVIGRDAVVNAARDNGRYVGQVIGNTASHAVQNVGRQTAVAHDLDRLDKVPPVGQSARIVYSNGRGQVDLGGRVQAPGRER